MTQVIVNLFHESRQIVGKTSSPLASSDVRFYKVERKFIFNSKGAVCKLLFQK